MAESADQVRALQQEVMDLKITNRAKDFFIEQLRKEREGFGLERQEYREKLMSFNHRVGELKTKLLQFGAPQAQNRSESQTSSGLNDGMVTRTSE